MPVPSALSILMLAPFWIVRRSTSASKAGFHSLAEARPIPGEDRRPGLDPGLEGLQAPEDPGGRMPESTSGPAARAAYRGCGFRPEVTGQFPRHRRLRYLSFECRRTEISRRPSRIWTFLSCLAMPWRDPERPGSGPVGHDLPEQIHPELATINMASAKSREGLTLGWQAGPGARCLEGSSWTFGMKEISFVTRDLTLTGSTHPTALPARQPAKPGIVPHPSDLSSRLPPEGRGPKCSRTTAAALLISRFTVMSGFVIRTAQNQWTCQCR